MEEEKMYFEKKENLTETIKFLKKIMPDKNPWIEERGNTLIVAGVLGSIHNITPQRRKLLLDIQNCHFFENVELSTGGALVIKADFKNPIDGISKLEFRIDKDM